MGINGLLKQNNYNLKGGSFLAKFLKQWQIQVMVLPGIICMIVFAYIPLYGLQIAFKDYKVYLSFKQAKWAGLKYFNEFFAGSDFWILMKNTLAISILNIAVLTPLAIILALMLNELKYNGFKRSVQTITYLPYFISWIVMAGIMLELVGEMGILNDLLIFLGLIKDRIVFISEPNYFWTIVTLSSLWKNLGWCTIIYLAAIASVNQEIYDSATVDGAGRFRKMWNVTLPSIKLTIAVLLILNIASLLNSNFEQILPLSNVLNQSASDVLDVYVYRMGLGKGYYSLATAVGLFKSVFCCILFVSSNFVCRKVADVSFF